jgi:hypothetical protein
MIPVIAQESMPQHAHFRHLAMPATVDGGIAASEGFVGTRAAFQGNRTPKPVERELFSLLFQCIIENIASQQNSILQRTICPTI